MRCEKEVGALGFCSAPSRVKGFTVFFFFLGNFTNYPTNTKYYKTAQFSP